MISSYILINYNTAKNNNYHINSDEDTFSCFKKTKEYYKCIKSPCNGNIDFVIGNKDRYYPLSDNYKLFDIPEYLKETNILIYIVCLCNEKIERECVRKTWSKNDNGYSTIFIVGNTNIKCENDLKRENIINKDIIRININENFFNNTLFTKYLFKLLPQISNSINYFIKASLDMIINWKKFEIEFNEIIKEKSDIFIIPYDFYLKKIPSKDNEKYSSSKDIADYYNKLIPKKGIYCFGGYFYGYNRYISSMLFNQSEKYNKLIGCEDQYICWLFYTLKFNNYRKIYSTCSVDNNLNKNKKYSLIHRTKGNDMFSLYKYLNFR